MIATLSSPCRQPLSPLLTPRSPLTPDGAFPPGTLACGLDCTAARTPAGDTETQRARRRRRGDTADRSGVLDRCSVAQTRCSGPV